MFHTLHTQNCRRNCEEAKTVGKVKEAGEEVTGSSNGLSHGT